MGRMYIRQTRTNNKATGEGYFTYRLVRGERIGGKVRQITVLNLGRHFPFKREKSPTVPVDRNLTSPSNGKTGRCCAAASKTCCDPKKRCFPNRVRNRSNAPRNGMRDS